MKGSPFGIPHSDFAIQACPAAIHGMGGVGKTRATIEYAWKRAFDYRAFFFIYVDTPEALQRDFTSTSPPKSST